MKYLKINFEKDHDSLDECNRTMSVKQLIYELNQYDKQSLVCISLDDGDYYSCIFSSRFNEIEISDDYDEDNWMYKLTKQQQELLKEHGFSFSKKLGLVSTKESAKVYASISYDEKQKHFYVLMFNHRINNDTDLKNAQIEFTWKSQLAIDLNKLKGSDSNV